MVKHSMDLLELLRKRGMDGDVDFLREALRVLVDGIMDAEVSAQIGAEHGERSSERVTYRNGYRNRTWDTRVGTMELHIPKLREGSYFPSLQAHTVGGTFEFTFVPPKPANNGGGNPKNRKSGAPTRRSPTTTTNATGNGEIPLQSSFPMGDIAEREADEPRINPMAIRPQPSPRGRVGKPATKAGRTPLTAEQKQEHSRKRATERRQRQKENGLCVGCPNKPIEGQTRCTECAEKHRARLRPYAETHRRAQGAKPTQRISEAELLQLIQAEVDARGPQVSDPSIGKAQPDSKSLSRDQRKSLGICSDCDYPSQDGHTRCTLCLLRLRLNARRRRAKAPPGSTTASKADTAGPGRHHPPKPRR